MPEGAKRKKFHDKDKYYRLAKEQGYRSRAAFKLTQINRKYHFLENAKIVIDLCAAPGGWTQVASRTMAKTNNSGSNILLAVDILPIRKIPNVITIIGDITTDKCKAQIKSQLQTAMADVVLCDGAPNVGASYDKDAYEQNEIALHSLKCATQHLKRNGTFVTKLYRSSDYSSFMWVVKQLFEKVQAVKPSASRSQSAEIFLVCTGYLDPTSIDPKMLDPKSVFEQVDGAATGGGDGIQNTGGKVTIFHKKFADKKKSRQGYDMDTMDFAMRNIGSVCDFVESSGSAYGSSIGTDEKDPIQMLSFCTGLSFTCHLCKEKEERKRKEEDYSDIPDCNCEFYLNHRLTTTEIKACVSDLKVLNKGDFKGLLTWREKMKAFIKAAQSDGSDDDKEEEAGKIEAEGDVGSDVEEERIQAEIEQMRQRKLREQKRTKRKDREAKAKRRKRAALGMDLSPVELPDNDKMFSLASIPNEEKLAKASEVDLNKVTDDQIFEEEEEVEDDNVERDEEGIVLAQGEEDDLDEKTGYSFRLDRELDADYDRYLKYTKTNDVKVGTKMAKRKKKALRAKASDEADEDAENTMIMDNDTKAYTEMLQGPKDSDDSSDDEEEGASSDDDDGFRSAPMTPSEHKKRVEEKQVDKDGDTILEKNPLIHRMPEEATSTKTARWFSNPLFENIGTTASFATMPGQSTVGKSEGASGDSDYDSSSDVDQVEDLSSDDEKKPKKNGRNKKMAKNESDDEDTEAITADSILAMMPKTDKQLRHEKRLKSLERAERKKARKARQAGEIEGGFEVVEGNDEEANNTKMENMTTGEKKRLVQARALIKAGLGSGGGAKESDGFEVVSKADSKKAGALLPTMDPRKYDSDNEDYDSDDYAETLALGTMMLRKSKAKSLVDASYNRFAWNDPEDLPDWFQDDETRHYRPQLPIPPELLAKMKEKFISLAVRPITKVAEARFRKNKRAKSKLAVAKKKAESVANSSDMTEAMKLKAISKAMRGNEASRPSKTYVVSKKGGGAAGGRGIKVVDARMRSDKRGMERATKKRKTGKKGGMTGSKKRRNHS